VTAFLAVVDGRLTEPDPVTGSLWAGIGSDILALLAWDPEVRVLSFPSDHQLLGWPVCLVDNCTKPSFNTSQLCSGCTNRWKKYGDGMPVEEFAATAKRHWRSIGVQACTVPGCQRPWKTSRKPLCVAHYYQQQQALRLPVEEFVQDPRVVALPSFGRCTVAACPRARVGQKHGYCECHMQRLRLDRRNPEFDEHQWRLTTPAIAENTDVSLRGLADRVQAEVLYGLQERTRNGIQTRDYHVRALCDLARRRQVGSLEELPDDLSKSIRGLRWSFLKYAGHLQLSADEERHKDVWNAVAFGYRGTLRFTEITQGWLREAAKQWAYDDLPRRRGDRPAATIQAQLNSLNRLSDSLRLQRQDHGDIPSALSRVDITAFCNRLAYLASQGTVSARSRTETCRDLRRLLSRMRHGHDPSRRALPRTP
jgi:hypothetical protein